MATYSRDRDIKRTRKDHICDYCLRTIPAGSHASNEIYLCEGYTESRYCCDECLKYRSDFWWYVEGECGDIYSEFRDFVLDHNLPHSAFDSGEDE